MAHRRLLPVILVGVVSLAASGASGQGSCAACHIANDDQAIVASGESRDVHLADFLDSPHFTARIGCQACHGGDAAAFDEALAHRGVSSSRLQWSPTHAKNLSATCGRCHSTIFGAYSQHQHHDLVQSGDARAPSCATCHGEVASHLLPLAPRACSSCHSGEPDAIASSDVSRGGDLLAMMREVGVLRRKVELRIARVRDPALSHLAQVAAVLDRRLAPRLVDQDLPHGARGGAVEVGPSLPSGILLADEP